MVQSNPISKSPLRKIYHKKGLKALEGGQNLKILAMDRENSGMISCETE